MHPLSHNLVVVLGLLKRGLTSKKSVWIRDGHRIVVMTF